MQSQVRVRKRIYCSAIRHLAAGYQAGDQTSHSSARRMRNLNDTESEERLLFDKEK